ncbi:nucleotidyl transferase AbiEii/AbiGii toxin family protein [Bacterioplanoides sp.]|uniref:nucleotidyl transferase AbiEii/AbiGii toxin family protein n=1 Tax=Bacterioplanoides sp. TaxID=2066072 RepID=UPI003B59C520
MIELVRTHHQLIWDALSHFDSSYLEANNILFGGGTRIALELGEYRESTDIDFFCAGRSSYRAVRSQTTNSSLGHVLNENSGLEFLRDIRADRDAVRTYVRTPEDGTPIKLEFVHFDICDIVQDEGDTLFNVPVVDRATCFTTKLLANADRFDNPSRKDIFDLCMMRREWGEIPVEAWENADRTYGYPTIFQGLYGALSKLMDESDSAIETAVDSLKIEENLANELIDDVSELLLSETQIKEAEV